MSGSKVNEMTRKQVLGAVRAIPKEKHFVWDGADEDDRPATDEELAAGLATAARKRGRPAGSNKTSTTIRFDADVVEAFRAGGPGWQSRMNDVLRQWLKRHPAS